MVDILPNIKYHVDASVILSKTLNSLNCDLCSPLVRKMEYTR